MSHSRPDSKKSALSATIPTKSQPVEAFSPISGQSLVTADVVDLTLGDEILIPPKRYQQEHCHMNYRQKQEQWMKDLTEYTRKLRRVIWYLEYRRYVTVFAISTEQNVWTIALNYFRNFRYGLNEAMETSYPCVLAFLGTAMARDMTDGSVCGPEAILSNWRLFSHIFEDIFLELNSLKQGTTANTLVATTTLSITISKKTLRLIFPRLLSDDYAVLHLAAKLIDQRIVMRGSVWFQWNNNMKRVERIHSQADMLTPILQIVGSLEKVSRVFNGALVTPECKLVPDISNDFQYWMQFSKLEMGEDKSRNVQSTR